MTAEQPAPPGRYDFGLSAEEEARAARLHADAIVFDLVSQRAGANIFDHYPAPLRDELAAVIAQPGDMWTRYLRANNWPYELALAARSDLIFEWYRQGGLTAITHWFEISSDLGPEIDASRFFDLPWMREATSAADIRRAKADGVIASYGYCQPMGSIPNDLGVIDRAHAKGLRALMLTYNSMTTVGVGCTERVDAGLSRHGVRVVERCNALGVIVDVSHCGPETSLDACRVSKAPVTANHTAARAVHQHARGKTDDCLRAIADTGGVIGVVAVPAFLTDAARPGIEHMLDHIEHVAGLVGWRHVALGTDWPLQAPLELVIPTLSPGNTQTGFRPEDRLDLAMNLRGFDDCRDMPNITRGLVGRGWEDDAIRGVLGENALRVFETVCG